jgi:NAD(P)-dependent dehydrogenase (short-subunit alcohol dehydrogenase family)
LRAAGVDVLAIPCDVSDQAQVDRLVAKATARFGQIDILVANAGQIEVGPFATMTDDDFENALDVMFWGILRPVRAVLPAMQARGRGKIVTITSIGGKVSIPHLIPYSAAKFAAVGLSEGLRAELAGTGVTVTTVVPGLMRTGSHLNVEYRGNPEAEFVWFSLGPSLPIVSMDAGRAAEQIVSATIRGDAEVILSIPAAALARVHGLLPGLTTQILTLVNRFLPSTPDDGERRAIGHEIDERNRSKVLEVATTLGRNAACRFNQVPPPSRTKRSTP